MKLLHSVESAFLLIMALSAIQGCDSDVERPKPTPVFAAASDDVEQMGVFIDQGLNVNDRYRYGHTLLHIASMDGSINVVRLLLSEGALLDIEDSNGDTALFHAAGTDRFEIVKILLEAGATPNVVNENGNCPLTVAIAETNLEVARLLREYAAKECS